MFKKLSALFLCLLLLTSFGADCQSSVLTTSDGKVLLAGGVPLLSTPPTKMWQGMGNNMQFTVQGFQGQRAQLTRMQHVSHSNIYAIQVPVPVFFTTGTPIADTLYSGKQAQFNFQFGLEYPFHTASTGIPARTPFTFNSGATNYFNYNNGTWSGGWYKLSDPITVSIPANTPFGSWNEIEVPDVTIATNAPTSIGTNVLNFASTTGFTSGFYIIDKTNPAAIPTNATISSLTSTTVTLSANVVSPGVSSGDVISVYPNAALPYSTNCTNYIERWTLTSASTGSFISAFGGTDAAINATSATHLLGGESGFGQCWTPPFFMILTDTGTQMIDIIGDSQNYGVGEGYYFPWATSTNFVAGQQAGSNLYAGNGGIFTETAATCTSASSGTGPVGSGTGIVDGTCLWNFTPGSSLTGDANGSAQFNMGYVSRWVYEVLGLNYVNFGRGSDRLQYLATSANWLGRQALAVLSNPTGIESENGGNDINGGSTVAQTVTYAQSVYATMRSILPGRKIVQAVMTPVATTTDHFSTLVNQTTGTSCPNRKTWNDSDVRTPATLGTDGYIDAMTAVESGYIQGNTSTESCKWIVNGTYNYCNPDDGVHMTSNCIYAGAHGINAFNSSGSSVANPWQ